MVAIADLKLFKTTNNLGGVITTTQVQNATPNNLFVNVPKNELVTGEDYYAAIYLKNTHISESMDNFKMWLSAKSFPQDTEIKWGFDPTTVVGAGGSGYQWDPSKTFNGSSDTVEIPDVAELDLTTFSVGLYFKTLATDTDEYLISKGADAGTTEGMNYAIRINNTGNLNAFFWVYRQCKKGSYISINI
jgi:hypothetical protein